jgi:cell division protein FtsQ
MLPLSTVQVRRLVAAAGVAAAVGSSPWWGTRALGTLAFFRVRAVEVEGAHYVAAGDVVSRLHVDTSASVWSELGPLEARVQRLPGIRDVTVRRKLPSTLVVRIVERTPVALVSSGADLRAYDGSAVPLPIDLSRADLDLPVVTQLDANTLRLLANLRQSVPVFYTQISQVRRSSTGDLVFQLPTMRVLAAPNIDAQRFAAVPAVTADLARRHVRAQELDFRYRDQVVARLP